VEVEGGEGDVVPGEGGAELIEAVDRLAVVGVVAHGGFPFLCGV
jgi:hypothetical protein